MSEDKNRDKKFLIPGIPVETRVRRNRDSFETESEVSTDSSFRSNESYVSPTVPLPPGLLARQHIDEIPNSNFKSPSQSVFDQLRPVLNEFVKTHDQELKRLKSFVCTIANISDKDCVLLLAENSKTFIFSDDFKDRNLIVIQENKVIFATHESYGQFMDKVRVGNDIYVLDRELNYGTLGGFVKCSDLNEVTSNDSIVYGLTCHHVIPNNKDFQQPSLAAIEDMSAKSKKTKFDYNAGKSSNLGACFITEDCHWIDYQLLTLSRKIYTPYNQIKFEMSDSLEAPSPEVDLNNNSVAYELKKNLTKFAKVGATTGWTSGFLHSGGRNDCYVKISKDTIMPDHIGKFTIDGIECAYTREFAFVCHSKNMSYAFAKEGDSGALVYMQDNNKIVGMVFAVTTSDPLLAFVTPISDIYNHCLSVHHKKLEFKLD